MKSNLPVLVFLGTILISISSCTDDYFDFDNFRVDPIKPEIAIPLINSSLTPRDIFLAKETSDAISTNADGFISLVYDKGGLRINSSDLINIPNQSFRESTNLTTTDISNLPIQGSITKTFSGSYNFNNPNGIRLDSALIKSGSLEFNLSSDLQHGVNAKVTFPTFLSNGIPLEIDLTASFNGTTPTSDISLIDLSNYTISLDNSSGSRLPLDYEITVNYTGNPLSTQDSIRLSFKTESLEFKSFWGYGGQQLITFPQDTLALTIFKGAVGGNFSVAEPKLTITTINSFGIPFSVQFNRLDANTINSGEIPVQLSQNPIFINEPSFIGDSAITQVILDANNSNIAPIISSLPKDFVFDIVANTNPNGNISQNFVSDDSQVNVNVKLELPLQGTLSDYVLVDTFDFEFDNTQLLDAATFRTNITNEFPVDADIQIYFADGNARILDSLFIGQKKLILSGAIDADGKVIQPTNETEDTDIDKVGLTNLFRSSKVIIKANLSTTNSGGTVVRFYDNYRLDVKLGIKAKFNLDFD
tara:strand:- start:3033 stop:4625 length:1593 start_codon:yes stop_codon:yes gene_type:complete